MANTHTFITCNGGLEAVAEIQSNSHVFIYKLLILYSSIADIT